MKNLTNLTISDSFINSNGAAKKDNKSCMVLDGNGDPIAQTFSNSLKEAVLIANLIKESPEILKALENMLAVFDGDKMHPQGSIEAIRCQEAREIIKKATE